MLWLIALLGAHVAFVASTIRLTRVSPDTFPLRAASPLSRYDLVFMASATLFILTARLPILQLASDVHPDEAQYGANAIMAVRGWLNWDTLDSGSSGPLNSMIQAWPLLLGFDITFTTVHITGAVLACGLASLVYLVLNAEFGRAYALVFSLPLVLFFGATTHTDFVHASSLYFPVTLATFGAFCGDLGLAAA